MDNDFITLIQYILLGLLQGFTEPIPISSSGHIVLARELFHIETPGMTFEAIVNTGSLIAVIIIYFKDISRLTKNGFRYILTRDQEAKSDFHFILLLVIATIPAGIFGLLLNNSFEAKPFIVGITLLITGVALWIIRNLRGRKGEKQISTKDAIIVGLAQSVALFPGISRSGATIVASMLLGMKQDTALRFSFLLYIPISLGVAVMSFSDIVGDESLKTLLIPYLLAFMASIIASYFALKWFMNIMAKGNLKYFAFYCFVVGTLVILFLK
ncbi:undecaprenyl-diphosphate phosphatase [Ornithinibacillus scapharcae]|uniref:undecaprenyl-diphosphate phosphatase n=1 Tax=Ornithinibacillus scapharcae TaxID=1147159 RepID=UPI000225B547|nr:undecaprenyl-diphosphate phosphatase [Ornithinibacillus scapharcae]